MAKEIERKFLVNQLPFDSATHPCVPIEQGYLALEPGGHEVRLRRKGNLYFLTIKSQGGLVREEYEVEMTRIQFETLWPGTKGRRLQKDRYLFEGFELDLYKGNLKGLLVAEIEFEEEEKAQSFLLPEWLGAEITHINFIKNRNLLQYESWEAIQKELGL